MRYALALFLLIGLARADQWTFDTIRIGKGAAGTYTVECTVKGAVRDVSAASGTLRVYSVPPVKGVGGTVLVTRTLTPTGTAGQLGFTLAATDLIVPGSYYLEVTVSDPTFIDVWHGSVAVEGR